MFVPLIKFKFSSFGHPCRQAYQWTLDEVLFIGDTLFGLLFKVVTLRLKSSVK